MGKKVQIKWKDAWIENEILKEELENLKNPQTLCTLIGFLVFDNGDTIGVAAEQVTGNHEEISYRAVTFVPKCLIIDIKEI